MLRSLYINDILIIDRLELEFEAGLNVLTGETGAGKSILLDALGFVLGWRGRADIVRQGAEFGEVVASFELDPGHPAMQILQDAGFAGGEELILRRVNRKDGRKTAWVNDRRCSGEFLRTLSATLVELHGQNDDRGLLNPNMHRILLDQFGGHDKALDETAAAWRDVSAANTALAAAQKNLSEMRAEEEFLRHAADELVSLNPQSGEDQKLDQRRRQLQAADRIREDVVRGLQAVSAEGAEGALRDGLRWLEGVAAEAEDALDAPIAALFRALDALNEASQGVEAALDAMRFDPEELDAAETRLFAIRALARKHDVDVDDLAGLREGFEHKLTLLDQGEGDISELEKAAKDAQLRYQKTAMTLRGLRQNAAKALDAAMEKELEPLKMERAIFRTLLSEAPEGKAGHDAVAFSAATNPGAPAGPIDRIASGGELSRFLLALKVCLAGQGAQTMIFDEIDRGVGGATADAVGRRLSKLSKENQLLVVTHSPQVAALGAHHWRVEKQIKNDVTTSKVIALSQEQRIDEIARMLSGDSISDEARSAARVLLNG